MWSAARRQGSAFWTIFGLSCLGEILWFLLVNVGFFSDTLQYLGFARELHHRQIPYFADGSYGPDFDVTSAARRTLGYPLLMLIAGVPQTGSILGILAIQALMAIAMPLLAYKIIEPWGRRAAFVTAVVLIVSLEPFIYSKAILSDHAFKFLLLLLVYLAVRAYRTPTRGSFFAIGTASIMLVLVRPQGSVAVLLVFGLLMIAHPRRFIALAGHSLGVGAILGIFSVVIAAHLASYVPRELPQHLQARRSIAGDIQTLLLYHAYTCAIGERPALEAAKGAERSELRSVLLAYANDHVEDWAALQPAHYFARFKDDPSRLVDEIYRNPNPYYLNMIRLAAAAPNDPGGGQSTGGNLLWRVIWETYRSEPRLIVSFITRYVSGSAASSGGQQAWSQFYTTGLSPFSAQNGPASREILDLVRIYVADFPEYLPPQWQNYPGGADKLIDDVFIAQPSESQWYFLWEVVDRLKGRLESGRIFFESLREFPDIFYLKSLSSLDKLGEISSELRPISD
jgi:hypothetical protein